MKSRLRFCSILLLVSGFAVLVTVGQTIRGQKENPVTKFRSDRHQEFADPKRSPLEPEEVPRFKGLKYFEVNSRFRLQARFVRTPNEKKFNLPTSSGITKVYLKYGELVFTLAENQYSLGVYQSETLSQTEKYRDYLLIPFTDMTNGKTTYGGGRYIDFQIPTAELVTLDFNLAYNPSCAFSNRYNCPIPPRENRLNTKIDVGEKLYRKLSTRSFAGISSLR
ncbi:MAG: DUF1684 domain-containing protein [Pyrinomonadaceae bacterium]